MFPFLSSFGIKKILPFSLSSSNLPSSIPSFQSHLAIPPSALMSVEIIYPSSESPGQLNSPRISFSYDLNQEEDVAPSGDANSLLDPTFDFNFNFDFDFSTPQNFPFDLSSADEIFSNGVILPAQIKPQNQTKTQETESTQDPNSPEQSVPTSKKNKKKNKKIMRLKEFLSCSTDTEEDDDKPLTKSFWQFRRSSSLNNVGTLINRPLQFLSRSNSTGSAPNPKPTSGKQNQTKRPPARVFSRSSSCNSYYPYNNSAKRALPALKKSYSRSYDNGIRVSPVLHISHACIAKGTASFFGLAAFFCTGKSRTNRKSFIP